MTSNNLRDNYPEIANEWHPTKNGKLRPQDVLCGSHTKVWWLCEKGHEWKAQIYHRLNDGGCPYCSGHRVLRGYNDLATTNPQLAAEWNYEKNGAYIPQMVTAGSNKKVWWKCHKGHEWQAQINARNRGNSCPVCANQMVLAGYNDLATTNPLLASEWNYEKNGALTPRMVTAGSSKKVWWKCSKGHEWLAGIGQRNNRLGCPICSNKMVLSGYNDLATTNPEIAAEWNCEKNGTLTPNMVTAGSNKKVWWMCRNGHEWQAQVNARLQGAGCAKCSAYQKTSFPEQAILFYIRKLYPDVKSGYKDLFGSRNKTMELDIYIPSVKTAIEYDGLVWHSSEKALKREHEKYEICKRHKITLIRVKENVELGSSACDILIQSDYKANYRYFGNTLAKISKYIPLPEDIDVYRDRNKIYTQYMPDYNLNSLVNTNPQLAAEWNYERNIPLTPQMVTAGNRNKVWWKCNKGHEWQASIRERVRGTKCPFCTNRKIWIGYNDLTTTNPRLAAEWNYEKNGALTPQMVTAGSGKKVWWKCRKGHQWQAQINHRQGNDGCPYCSGHRVLSGYNDLATTNPQLAAEWNHGKNGALRPQMVTAGSNKKVWWMCRKGHEWQAQINARNRGNGCPKCAKEHRKN